MKIQFQNVLVVVFGLFAIRKILLSCHLLDGEIGESGEREKRNDQKKWTNGPTISSDGSLYFKCLNWIFLFVFHWWTKTREPCAICISSPLIRLDLYRFWTDRSQSRFLIVIVLSAKKKPTTTEKRIFWMKSAKKNTVNEIQKLKLRQTKKRRSSWNRKQKWRKQNKTKENGILHVSVTNYFW